MCVGLDARIDFQNGLDGMLLSHFTEDFLRASWATWEPWRIGTGGSVAAAIQRPVPKATMPRANGKGGLHSQGCCLGVIGYRSGRVSGES